MIQYNNFDFTILPAQEPGKYLIYVDSQTQGQITSSIALDRGSGEFNAWLETVDNRSIGQAQLKDFGVFLFEALFHGEVQQLWERSLGEVLQQPECGLRLRLRIEPRELAALPWEFLYSPTRQLFLATSSETPLTRYINMLEPIPKLMISGTARALVIIPSLWGLNVEAEKEVLQKAFAKIKQRITLDYLEGQVTPSRVRAALGEHEYHLVHYIGHGEFATGGPRLYLNDENGALLPLSDEQFGAFLTNHQFVKLIVLNACHGGKQDSNRALSGVAPLLVKRGLPAVVAMQHAITDDDAILFAQEFYGELCASTNSGLVDMAISRARNALWQESKNPHAFGTPVLFMRSDTGKLWDTSNEVVPTPSRVFPIKKLLIQALPAFVLIVVLIILALGTKTQEVNLEAFAENFSFRCAARGFLINSLPVETIHFTHFGTLAWRINECRSLPGQEIIFRRTATPADLAVLPHEQDYPSLQFTGKDLIIKEVEMQKGMMVHCNLTPDDGSIKLDLLQAAPSLALQLADMLEMTLQDCSMRLIDDTQTREFEISEGQRSYWIVVDSASALLKILGSKMQLTSSFLVPSASFQYQEKLLETDIRTDSISFTQIDFTRPGPISTLSKLIVTFPEMDNLQLKWDGPIVYLKHAVMQDFVLKYLQLEEQPRRFKIFLTGRSDELVVGVNTKFLKNIAPSTLRWLWSRQEIVLIISCLAWLIGAQLALWSFLKKAS